MSHRKRHFLTWASLVSIIIGLSAIYVFGGQMLDFTKKALAVADTPAKVDILTAKIDRVERTLDRMQFYLNMPTNGLAMGYNTE